MLTNNQTEWFFLNESTFNILFVIFFALYVRQIYNHIPPPPLSPTPCPFTPGWEMLFSAPPYACHLVPPAPDGENSIWLFKAALVVTISGSTILHAQRPGRLSHGRVVWLGRLSACSLVVKGHYALRNVLVWLVFLYYWDRPGLLTGSVCIGMYGVGFVRPILLNVSTVHAETMWGLPTCSQARGISTRWKLLSAHFMCGARLLFFLDNGYGSNMGSRANAS